MDRMYDAGRGVGKASVSEPRIESKKRNPFDVGTCLMKRVTQSVIMDFVF
jgi:hypothetical protein